MTWEANRAGEIHERHLHRLGNLTLCGLEVGAALGAHSFGKKKELYEKSEVLMTRRLADVPRWDENAIRRRAEQLARKALKLWPWDGGS